MRVRVLAICPSWAPEASADAVQAVARVLAAADGSPLDVVSGPRPPAAADRLVADLPEGRHWSLPRLPLEEQVELVWGRIEEWVAGPWDYHLVCSGPGDPVGHLVAASQKLIHPEVAWQAHLTAPVHRSGGDVEDGPLRGQVRDVIARGARELGVQLPEDGTVVQWCDRLVAGLADQVVCASDRLAGALRSTDPAPAARHSTWTGTPWPDLAPASDMDAPGDPGVVDVVMVDTGGGAGAELVGQALALAPPALRETVAVQVLDEAAACTRAGLERALAADVVALVDPRQHHPAAGLVAPYPADVLAKLPGAPDLWLVTRDGSDLDSRPSAYRSPLNHPTAALLVLDRIRRAAAGRG